MWRIHVIRFETPHVHFFLQSNNIFTVHALMQTFQGLPSCDVSRFYLILPRLLALGRHSQFRVFCSNQ